MAVLLLLFIISFGLATFVENDFGTFVARRYFYLALWSKIVWILLIINLIGVFVIRRLYTFRKLHVSLFHSGFIVILLGACVTHIFGYEGTMFIANGETSNSMTTQNNQLTMVRETPLDTVKKTMIWKSDPKKNRPLLSIENTDLYFNTIRENMCLDFSLKHDYQIHNILLVPSSDSTVLERKKFFASLALGDTVYNFSLAPEVIELPFSIRLDSFKLQRYPGSGSPSSFSSFVQLTNDKETIPYHIYMNNILSTQGYRIYQSSYFTNEQGTILTVNKDFLGTTITYIGYLMLLLGFLAILCNPRSFLHKTVVRKTILPLIFFLCCVVGKTTFALPIQSIDSLPRASKEHAQQFGTLYVQNFKGRIQTLYTFGLEILRKISKKDEIHGYKSDEFILSVSMYPHAWWHVPIIKVENKELQKILQYEGNNIPFINFFEGRELRYKLSEYVNKAQNKKPALRTKFDKEIIKVDERVNIFYQFIMGHALKILPSTKNLEWISPTETKFSSDSTAEGNFMRHIFPYYISTVIDAVNSGNYQDANQLLESGIRNFQKKKSKVELPPQQYVKVEMWYHRINVFFWLFPFYFISGFLMITLLIYGIVFDTHKIKNSFFILKVLCTLGFIIHTVGLIARWYLSGHPPMSNGFETLIYVSWCMVLLSIVFIRISSLTSAIAIFSAALPLLVAHLTEMDPEISNLVPVLQSLWLLIHVSIITASYSFFAIMALIAILFFVLLLFIRQTNKIRVEEAIYGITAISNKIAILGLGFLTLGIFMGAVWANQSWGRYWAWDPKETWSLISMLCYVILTHSRFIKPLSSLFVYHTMALLCFSSILMTYFGVNFYLSGLHSYASGDPVALPFYVYVIILILILLVCSSYFHYKRLLKK